MANWTPEEDELIQVPDSPWPSRNGRVGGVGGRHRQGAEYLPRKRPALAQCAGIARQGQGQETADEGQTRQGQIRGTASATAFTCTAAILAVLEEVLMTPTVCWPFRARFPS